MKAISIDTLYLILDKQISLAESYSEITNLSNIIKMCRLKPYSYFFESKSKNLLLYKSWFDEFGNSLKIIKRDRVKIIYNDLNLDRKNISSTDLYYGLSVDKIAKMSKLLFICAGKDDDLIDDCFFISYLGIDDYLRTYLYMYGELKQVSSLFLGLANLKLIAKNLDIKYFKELKKKENIAYPCVEAKAWLSYNPPSQDFLSILESSNEAVFLLTER
jgi:hypothetical protein